MAAIDLPSVREVGKELRELSREFPEVDRGEADTEIEVRLQVLPDGTWQVHYGDPGFDTDHQGYWGSTFILPHISRMEAEEAAHEMLSQVEDAIAQDEGEFHGDDEDEVEGPVEGDLVTEDHRTFWGHDMQRRRPAVTVDDVEDPWPEIDAWMEKQQFYPNVWFLSDHGNFTLLKKD